MHKKVFLILLLLILAGASWSQNIDAPLISPEAAHAILSSGKEVLLLDVRTHDEFISRHIPGAVLFPSTEINKDSAARVIGPDFGRLLIVYCASGGRSKASSALLLSLGYTNVWNMGGISSWPFEVEKGEASATR
jgi:rhodanese-related sulfurtransferase